MSRLKPNVILITIDALRADHLGCYGYPRRTSPFIDSLAAEGALFSQAITNGGGTPEAFPSILASVSPPMYSSQYKTLYKRSFTLPEVLKEEGYETAAFHSNPYLSRFFYYHKGFDVFEDEMGKVDWFVELRKKLITIARKLPSNLVKLLARTNVANPPIVQADGITRKAISWVRTKSQGFFLWVHYMDVHSPRIPPSKYLSRFCTVPTEYYDIPNLYNKVNKKPNALSAIEKRRLRDLYDASIRYVDDNLRMLCTQLSTPLSNTIVVVTSDHGEALGENGVYGHTDILYDHIIQIPLVIFGPGIQKGSIIEEQVELMDIAPTIADLLSFDVPNDFEGESLVSAMKGNKMRNKETISVTIDNRSKRRAISLRTEEYKCIRTDTLTDSDIVKEEFFDLKKDSGETTNLRDARTEEADLFLSKIERAISSETVSREKEEITSRERELLKEKLKALGYFG